MTRKISNKGSSIMENNKFVLSSFSYTISCFNCDSFDFLYKNH